MRYIIILPLLFITCAITASGQSNKVMAKIDTVRTPIDTIYFAGYKAINFKILCEENWYETEWEVYLCDRKLLTSFRWYPGPRLYNFGYNSKGVKKPHYIEDINGDGKGEIIFEVYSGGNNGRESAYIYTLDTLATLIGKFNGINTGLNMIRLDDLDGDSVPELIFNDMNYGCWPDGCAGAPAPYLVWKWNGNNYQLANFKLGNLILRQLNYWNPDSIPEILNTVKNDTSKIRNFDPNNEYGYPMILIDDMLALTYAGHRYDADKILEFAWAKGDTTILIFKKVFWDKVKSSYFWDNLQKSDW